MEKGKFNSYREGGMKMLRGAGGLKFRLCVRGALKDR